VFVCRQFKLKKKLSVPLSELVGEVYGTTYTVDTQHFVRCDTTADVFAMVGIESEAGVDNRNLPAAAAAQALCDADIQQLKAAGNDGSAIVSALVDNSDTFATKTEFSQAKYLKRKAKKYVVCVCVWTARIFLICC
jgi:hypothetical protein